MTAKPNLPLSAPTIRIHAADNVVIARRQLLGGTLLADEGGLAVAGRSEEHTSELQSR